MNLGLNTSYINISCPLCKAKIGRPCKVFKGRFKGQPVYIHTVRSQAWIKKYIKRKKVV